MNLHTITAYRKLIYIIALLLLFLAASLAIGGVLSKPASLTDEQILELRSRYRVYKGEPPTISMVEPKIEDVYKMSDAVILAEVLEVLPEYEVELVQGSNTTEGILYEKGKAYGMKSTASFMQYRVKIIEDISGKSFLNKEDIGNEIIIAVNSQLKGYVPEPEPGMIIVTPIKKGEDVHEGKYFFSKYGFYYVTDDGYVLSAFVEDARNIYTGKTLKFLKSKVQRLANSE